MRIFVTGGSGFIGKALVADLLGRGAEVRNLDLQPPHLPEQRPHWVQGSVLDLACVRAELVRFAPTHLIHLAAETSISPSPRGIEADYPINCGAVQVLAEAVADLPLERAVLVSTQYVCGPAGGLPQADDHWFPHTDYGQSKVVMEQAARAFPWPWSIVRPTYVWGPWHLKYFFDVCQTLAAGRYLHPAGAPVVRSYGFVASTAWTIAEAALNPVAVGRVIYATDEPEDSYAFVCRLSRALRGQDIRKVPRMLLRAVALVGDRWPRIPLNSFRYHAMTTSYPVPWQKSHALIGAPQVDLDVGAGVTAQWFHDRARRG